MQNHIIKFFLSAMFLSFPCAYFTAEGESVPTESPVAAVKAADEVVSLYHSMQLEGVVNWRAFKQAVTGYNRIKNRKRDVLTLIDFSKPSTEKRLYVFDMKHRRMLYSSVVSHGKNSGGNYATSFSNEYGSYKSSLGFYLTASTYQGRNGYSLILDGLEKDTTGPRTCHCESSVWLPYATISSASAADRRRCATTSALDITSRTASSPETPTIALPCVPTIATRSANG